MSVTEIGDVAWSPDYKSVAGPGPCVKEIRLPDSDPSEPVSLRQRWLTKEELAIVELLKTLRPGQELRVIRDELGGPLGYKVYDIIGWEDPT